MKPSQPYHAYTSAHREPGGLRALDFVVRGIESWRGSRLASLVRVLVVRSGSGQLALPLAVLGYSVTAVESDEVLLARLLESAKDASVAIRGVHGSLRDLTHETFDVVVDMGDARAYASQDAYADLRQRCAPHGCLFLSVLRRTLLSLPHRGFTPRQFASASFFFTHAFSLFTKLGGRRGSAAFHVCDSLDDWFASHISIVGKTVLVQATPRDPSMPYVMHVVPTFASGGAERVVYELTDRLPAHGFSTEAVACMGGGSLEHLFRDECLSYHVFPKRGPFGSFAFFSLWRVMSLERPDIVHTHLFGADVWGRLAAQLLHIPVVISTEHRMVHAETWLKRQVMRLLARRTDAIVAISKDVQRALEDIGIPRDRLRVIYNGVDMTRIALRGTRPFSDKPKLICVSRLAPGKGHAILLKALALVKSAWTLDIVGEGPLEAELKELAERLSIAPRIRWLGYRDDVASRLADADLCCFPSVSEGLGLALLEAAAAGVPLVVSDLPAFSEVLPQEWMTRVPPGDVPALAHAIQRVLEDPYHAIQNAKQGVARVREQFDREKMVRAYAELYRDRLTHRHV